MIDAIEGFRRVDKEKEVLLLCNKAVVVGGGEFEYIVLPLAALDEALLATVGDSVDSRHDGVRDNGCDQPVRNIVKGNGSCPGNGGGAVFWENAEAAQVELFGGGFA